MAELEDASEIVVLKSSSKKENFLFHNTLVCLVKALEGTYTLVDLRNESCIAGKIVKVDGYMNIEMEEAVFIDARGNKHYFSQFFVRHRNIRYVHIPKDFKSVELMQDQLNGMNRFKKAKKEKRTFKQVRAERYQKETLQNLNN
ncbi:unnamed protein product [Psylliodes chrysocephalus]|uniref:Sm domain-containing protein n=1 Tax=Psylliodes chrysocephalus TaxID=3402493 RepID=A0A9P0D534_9CUCU|nr:unnamed protein product [Psylliodes chrysocephala]